MRTPENLVRHELIGLRVVARGPSGKSGTVVDETRNMIAVETKAGEKQLSKEEHQFTFTLPEDGDVTVKGKLLVGRPEERLKKKFPQRGVS